MSTEVTTYLPILNLVATLIVGVILVASIIALKSTNTAMKQYMDIFKVDELKKYVELQKANYEAEASIEIANLRNIIKEYAVREMQKILESSKKINQEFLKLERKNEKTNKLVNEIIKGIKDKMGNVPKKR